MQQVRITRWPTAPLDPPPVAQWHFERDPAEELWRWHFDGRRATPLPDELVLRGLQSLNLDDEQAVVEFTNAYGGELGRQPPHLHQFGDGDLPLFDGFEDERWDRRGWDVWPVVPTIARLLRAARAAANHWEAYQNGDDPWEAWWAEGFNHRMNAGSPASWATAWMSFERVLTVGLSPLAPHVHVALPVARGGAPVVEPWRAVGLFTGLVAQVFNVVAEGERIRRCQNATCEQKFARQHGRARKGVSRTTGVLYCSHSCAKAQAQREYRRRQRQQSLSGGGG